MKEQKTQVRTADDKTRMVVMTALLAALACVATMVIRIPSPTGGYLNLGDTVVLLGAFLLGPLYGAVAGGVGSMLADLLSGYMIYAPATLVIKAAMAAAAGVWYRAARGHRSSTAVAAILGEVPMVVGYWAYDAWLLGSVAGGAAGIPSNLVQAALGIVVSTLLATLLRKNSGARTKFPNL